MEEILNIFQKIHICLLYTSKAIKMNATEELQMIDSYDKIDAVLERVAAIREV